MTAYRSQVPLGRDGFWQLLRAEFTKLRSVRGWVLALLGMMVVTVVVSLLAANGGRYSGYPELGPDGTAVNDGMEFVHQPLAGDGSVTARVTSLTSARDGAALPGWAKAGIVMKDGVRPGSPYVALLVTPGHGVRLQDDFVHDQGVGPSAVATGQPQWLRLTRAGDVFTAWTSGDGTTWHQVGSVRESHMTGSLEAGMFTASPDIETVSRGFGSTSIDDRPGRAEGVFDSVAVQGGAPDALWQADDLTAMPVIHVAGDPSQFPPAKRAAIDNAEAAQGPAPQNPGSMTVEGGVYTVTGEGDVAPAYLGNDPVQRALQGVFVAVLVAAAVGALFVTSEFRRGMFRTTLTASPRRGRVIAAKALVVGGVVFVCGIVASLITYPLSARELRAHGFTSPPFGSLSLANAAVQRDIVGTAAVLALTAVLALGVATAVRRSAAAVGLVAVLVLVPQILAFAVPLNAADWLLRVTPAAGFGVQQGDMGPLGMTQYQRLPEDGAYPLPPWVSLGVPALYAAVAVGLGVWRTRRRDA